MNFFCNAAAVLMTGLLVGCQTFSSNPAPDALASVIIAGRSTSEIEKATRDVFTEHGFRAGQVSAGRMIFQHEGSRLERVEYVTFMDEKTTVRVEVTLQDRGNQTTVVACNAQVVTNAGDPVLEDDHTVRKFSAKPYQSLLNEIRTRLD